MDNILSIKNLKKRYHTKEQEILAVDDFSFDINTGDFIAIVGPSGCGKSTILSILCNLEDKSDGEIIIKNNLKIGYMLQEDCLFEWRNILQNCLIGCANARVVKLLTEYAAFTGQTAPQAEYAFATPEFVRFVAFRMKRKASALHASAPSLPSVPLL